MGQKYLKMEDQKQPGLVRKEDVAKGEGLEPKVNVFKIFVKLWRRGEKTNITSTIADGVWVRGPQRPEAMGEFFIIFWKK